MKINWDYIKFTLLIALAVFLFAFSSQRNAARNLQAKEIVFLDTDVHFITQDMVNKLLIQNNEEVTSIAKEALDLNTIERRLDENPMISKAEVYLTIDGVLGTKIKQRKPIARVAGPKPFYLDEKGEPMPLSPVQAARVPLISGKKITDYSAIHQLLLHLENDTFMQNHVVGIHIEPDDEITLHFRVFDFVVQFGEVENIAKKFQNFKAFYQKTTKDNTLSKYTLVNLTLDNQVVATKL